jgi:hypothetical protein
MANKMTHILSGVKTGLGKSGGWRVASGKWQVTRGEGQRSRSKKMIGREEAQEGAKIKEERETRR